MPLGLLEIVKRLGYHPGTVSTIPVIERNRHLFITLALEMDEALPESRESALCQDYLQLALMYANAAVAIHLSPTETALPPKMLPEHGEPPRPENYLD
jgi:hypothetical protein